MKDRQAFLEFLDGVEQLATDVYHRVPAKLATMKAKIDAVRATIPTPQREDSNATPSAS